MLSDAVREEARTRQKALTTSSCTVCLLASCGPNNTQPRFLKRLLFYHGILVVWTSGDRAFLTKLATTLSGVLELSGVKTPHVGVHRDTICAHEITPRQLQRLNARPRECLSMTTFQFR